MFYDINENKEIKKLSGTKIGNTFFPEQLNNNALEKAKELGILPLEITEETIIFGNKVVDYNYEITEDKVIRSNIYEEKDLALMKTKILSKLKVICKEKILKKYSEIKQLNIIRQAKGYTESDLDKMNEFIDGIRIKFHEYEEQINNTEILEDLNISFEI